MGVLQNKIDFVAIISVSRANANGDPLNGNRPRTDYYGFGEISDVCIKRKIRNRFQDMGERIFVQSEDRCDDGYTCLKERAEALFKTIDVKKDKKNAMAAKDETAKRACAEWIDVRTFGQVFAFKGGDKDGVSIGVRGPVSIHQAVSVSPVETISMQITKSVNGESAEKKASDTMGMKHFVNFGVYIIKGSINVQLAEKTGFTEEDSGKLKESLRTLFANDASSARPEGSMEVVTLYWWEHNCKEGQYSSAKVHRSVKVELKTDVDMPSSLDDYDITLEELPGLKAEIIEGI